MFPNRFLRPIRLWLWLARRPISIRLLCEAHRILMAGVRSENLQPGEIRRSQNWVGGSRPGNARFVPPPPEEVPGALGALERWLHQDSNLPLLVTTDFRLPLLHRTYPGNRPDAPLFQILADDLARRCRELAAGTETLTLVFDKGNNSRENLDWVERSPFYFIGSLVPTQHPHLLDVSVDRMRSLEADGLPGVRGYRAQHHVESAFRQLKDSDCIAIRPQYHWTDQKITVHVFCCVLALMLCGLLQRELSHHGVKDSIPALLDALAGIREVDVLYPAREEGGKPELRTTLSQMTGEQRRMYDILGLDSHAIQPRTRPR